MERKNTVKVRCFLIRFTTEHWLLWFFVGDFTAVQLAAAAPVVAATLFVCFCGTIIQNGTESTATINRLYGEIDSTQAQRDRTLVLSSLKFRLY